MTDYRISEEKLKELVGAFCPMTRFDKERLEDFLKDKQPMQTLGFGKDNIINKAIISEEIEENTLVYEDTTSDEIASAILSRLYLPEPQQPTEAEIREKINNYINYGDWRTSTMDKLVQSIQRR